MEDNPIICRCEEVTRQEIIDAIADGAHSVSAVKRATRAGMGICQGRTCGRLVQGLLAREGVEAGPDKARYPVVPCPLAAMEEDA